LDALKAEIFLLGQHWHEMRQHVSSMSPEEACGLVAGKINRSILVIPVENALHSPVRFRMEPVQQLYALQKIEQEGLDLIAIYHSHPNGPEAPSATDVAEAFYPEAIHLIWFRRAGEWICRAFSITNGRIQEINLKVVEPE
jgi:proteasome lid subunit RPN8/RPN11